ncbi:MAG TPA: hypothetical protein VFO69_11020 [Allosphingosinicella sp.]|nr:hypothetical protein [Allosphingosinicella sp.]
MSGSKLYSDAFLGRDTLDVPVAALAAFAAAVLAFAVPAIRLTDWADALGLYALLPSALSENAARMGLGAGGAIFVFALVLGFLRQLDRLTDRAEERTSGAPRVRRRDVHPDAPTRRPLSAALELGEPDSAALAVETFPPWLSEALVARGDAAERPDNDGNEPDDLSALSSANDSEPLWETRDQARRQTIAELMGRLEKGVAHREPGPDAPVEAAGEPRPGQASEDRLQGAIESLHKYASRRA